jgi:uncharacterized iron-regulated membrane protein
MRCRSNGWARLLAGCAALALVWLGVLPWWGNRPAVRQRMEQLQQRGIDPGAMVYSELECMSAVDAQAADTRRKHPRVFLVPGATLATAAE